MPSLPGAHHRPDVFQKLDDVLKEHFRGLSVEKERELGILQEKFLSFSEKNASLKKEIEENIALGKEMTEHVVGVEARLKESQEKVKAVEEVLLNLEKSVEDQNKKNVLLESKNQELSAAISKGVQTLDKQFTDNEKLLETKASLSKEISKLEERKVRLDEQNTLVDESIRERMKATETAEAESNKKLAEISVQIVNEEQKLKSVQSEIQDSTDLLNSNIKSKEDLEVELDRKRSEFEQNLINEQKDLDDQIQAYKVNLDALTARSEVIVQQEKSLAERNMILKRGKDLLIDLATEMSMGKEVALGSIINQLKSI